jgi:hypothetical protein
VRYVLDFYATTPTEPGKGAAFYIDARPALDSLGAAADIARRAWRGAFS